MIDSIIIRIHHLRSKETLLKWLQWGSWKGSNDGTIEIPEHDASRHIVLKHVEYYDTKKTTKKLRNKHFIKSSSYNLNYLVDITNDYIEFNFSIPKYKYGTNVAQFVNHYRATSFELSKNSSFQYNLEGTYNRLLKFIENFFSRFAGVELEKMKEDVEINRLDICFNQIFDDKQEALAYLEHQKKIKKRGERLINDKINFATSIYLAGKYFTFKIYHKGTEFRKNDAPELRKANKRLKQQRFNVEKIGAFADRILRYEIEFKNAGLNYLYKNNLFRKYSKSFNGYKRSHRLTKKVENWSKGWSKSRRERAFEYMKTKEWREHERNAHLYTQMISQVSSFRLAVSKEAAISAKSDRPAEYRDKGKKVVVNDKALFSPALFNLCARDFKKFFSWYQLRSKTQMGNLQKVVAEANSHVKMMKRYNMKEKGVNYSTLNKYLTLIGTYGEKYLLQNKLYSRVQIWRLKKQLKGLGYSEMPVTDYGIKHDDTFFLYHHYMIDSYMMCR